MKVQDVMSKNPSTCRPNDTAQHVAKLLKDRNIGSVPVVADGSRLEGIITDRDLCLGIVAEGLDPKNTTIERLVTRNPVTCHADDNLENCERVMQEHQVRRIPVVDEKMQVIGIVSQADLALKDKSDRVQQTVAKISQPAA